MSGSLNYFFSSQQDQADLNAAEFQLSASNPSPTTTQIGSATLPTSYGTSGSSVSTLPNVSPLNLPSSTVGTDFRVRIKPLNSSFYGVSSPTTAANGSVPNTGSSSTSSTGQTSTTTPGAANLLAPLVNTGGVLFPYTPQITFQQDVDYSQTEMIQTNLTYEVYRRTPSVTITLSGKFTVQSQSEGVYAMAVIHFFRVASKMYFGTLAGANAGLPPPILLLNGYGTYMFNNLNCILKSHNFSFNEQMDTVPVQLAGGTVRLPAMFDLSVTLTVQQTPQAMRSQFNLDAFRTGALMNQGGWI